MNSIANTRREFLKTAAFLTTIGVTGMPRKCRALQGAGDEQHANASGQRAGSIVKAVKWNSIETGDTVLEKLQVLKDLGFDGVELDSENDLQRRDVLAARNRTGVAIHGLTDSVQWQNRLSSPDTEIRAAGLRGLQAALVDAKFYAASSVVLVPGRVTGEDESHDHVWQRSVAEIRKTLPLASRLGVRILIENAWNGFCEQPEQLRDYVDAFNSPWVGVCFDIGNQQKFTPSEGAIRILGRRIVKLDVKDWSREHGFCKLGDGDVNWDQVRKAIAEMEFTGWCTADVRSGDKPWLTDVAQRMDRCLGL